MIKKILKLQNEMYEWCEAVDARPDYYIYYEASLNMKELEESEFFWLKNVETDETECVSNSFKDFEWQCQNIIAHGTLESLT